MFDVQMSEPKLIDLPNDRTDTYLHAIKESVNEKVQLVVAVFPTSRDDRYSAFKKLCCIETPVPSQVNPDPFCCVCVCYEVWFVAGDQRTHYITAAEVTQRHAEDCVADQLQVRRRAVGCGDPCGRWL